MSTHLPARETGIGLRGRGRVGARARTNESRRGDYLGGVCAFIHLLGGCAFAVAGAFTCRFILLTSFRRGVILSLLAYAAAAAVVWLAGRSGADF
jgi:hypothetical protein